MSGSFLVFVLRRGVAVVLVSVAATSLVFLTLHGMFPEAFDDNHPLLVELVDFLRRTFLHLDFGRQGERTVLEIVASGLAADASIIFGGLLVGFLLGILAGAVAARRPRSLAARAIDVVGLLAVCTPVYLTCMAAILLFAPSIDAPIPLPFADPHAYVPIQHDPLQWARSLVIPWIAVALPLAAINMRLTRGDLQDVLDADWVRTAASKGLSSRRIMLRHMLPVAMPPAVSLTGAYVPLLVGNALLVEAVYEIPGSFQLMPGALSNGNYPVIQALVIVSAVFVVLCNAVADLVLAVLDPRVRESA